MAFLIIFGIVCIWLFGFFVGRNNPNISAVNSLISKGKAVVDATGKLIKKL